MPHAFLRTMQGWYRMMKPCTPRTIKLPPRMSARMHSARIYLARPLTRAQARSHKQIARAVRCGFRPIGATGMEGALACAHT